MNSGGLLYDACLRHTAATFWQTRGAGGAGGAVKRAVRWFELLALFGVVPAALAVWARGLSLPFLFVTAWVCLVVLWRDPTFQRDQLWRREQLWTWLRGPLALALGVCTLLAVGLYLLEPAAPLRPPARRRPGAGCW